MLCALARRVSTFDNFTAGRPGLSWIKNYIINPPSHCALCRFAGGGAGLPEWRLQAAQPGARRYHQHISLLSQCRCVAQRGEKLSTPAGEKNIDYEDRFRSVHSFSFWKKTKCICVLSSKKVKGKIRTLLYRTV